MSVFLLVRNFYEALSSVLKTLDKIGEYDIITEIGEYLYERNQLSAEDVGFFMFFWRKI